MRGGNGGPLEGDGADGVTDGVVVMHLHPDDVCHDLVGLRDRVACLVVQGARTLVVDASQVQRLSSATITALLWAQRRCRARGGSVVVRRPSAETLQLLVRTGLYDVLDVELGATPGAAVPGPGGGLAVGASA